jgi:MYXO-CTERM domain-containing protein
VEDDRLGGFSSLPPGLQPFETNIIGDHHLIHVGGGVRVVGRTSSRQECIGGCWVGGHLILQRTTDGSQPVPVELSAQLSAPVVLGRITTAVSAALLLALALAAAVRRRRRRSGAHPTA